MVVNQSWHPDTASTGQLCRDLAQDLVRGGWRVTVICGGQSRASADPGIEILATGPSDPVGSKGLRRILSWCAFILAATIRVFRIKRPDAIVCSTSPPFLASGCALAAMLRSARLLVWCMDVHPEAAVAAGLARSTSPLVRLLRSVDSWSLRRARRVVTLTASMRATLLRRGISADLVAIVPPWSPETVVKSGAGGGWRRELGLREEVLVVCYAGNLGIGHDAASLLEAIRQTADDAGIAWLVVGGGYGHRMISEASVVHQIGNVRMLDFVPRERLATLLATADVHVVTLEPAFETVMFPSKFVSALGIGRCTVVVGSADGEMASTVREHDCGLVVSPGDGLGLARAIRSCATDRRSTETRGARARQAYVIRFAAERALCQWREILESVTDTG